MVGSNVLINKDREKLPPSLSTYTNLIKKHLNLFLRYCMCEETKIHKSRWQHFIHIDSRKS